ncbi:MAG: FtsX-like permease family protein [Balneolaceae bacterium]
MKMLLYISWRNIWRHPARSGVLIGAIISGLWAGILISSWANGLVEQRVNRVIQEELTHLQIHHPNFLTEREPGMFIESFEQIYATLERDQRVKSFTARTLVDGMVQSPLTTSGVQIKGIMSDRERETTNFHENLVQGEYIDADVRNPVVIGRTLAEKLNVEIGNRIVLAFQDINNELISGAFNITGMFHTGQAMYDETAVFVRSEDLYLLLSDQPLFHEIAVMLKEDEDSEAVVADLNSQFENIIAETWLEISPEMRYMTQAGGTYMFYIMLVIMFALAFGILNTMLMAIFERMHELGMLMAIGMSKSRIFWMIILESLILTLTGAAAGMLLGHMSVEYLRKNGLDLTAVGGDSFELWGYDARVYPYVTPEEYISVTILVIVTAMLAAIYPAIKALRLTPGEVVKE